MVHSVESQIAPCAKVHVLRPKKSNPRRINGNPENQPLQLQYAEDFRTAPGRRPTEQISCHIQFLSNLYRDGTRIA